MAIQYDGVPRVGNDHATITRTLAVGNPGGGIGVRVIIDDVVVTSKAEALLMLEYLSVSALENVWPGT